MPTKKHTHTHTHTHTSPFRSCSKNKGPWGSLPSRPETASKPMWSSSLSDSDCVASVGNLRPKARPRASVEVVGNRDWKYGLRGPQAWKSLEVRDSAVGWGKGLDPIVLVQNGLYGWRSLFKQSQWTIHFYNLFSGTVDNITNVSNSHLYFEDFIPEVYFK